MKEDLDKLDPYKFSIKYTDKQGVKKVTTKKGSLEDLPNIEKTLEKDGNTIISIYSLNYLGSIINRTRKFIK